MHVWVVCIGEPLPTDDGHERMHRAGMLVQALLAKGHQVTWWSSSFNHSSKRHRCNQSRQRVAWEECRLWLLHGIGYARNIGIRRLINHVQIAREFKRLAAEGPVPDLIFCCWPAIELSLQAVEFAEAHSIPIVLDVRDLWPDIFRDAVPKPLRPFANVILAPIDRMTKSAFRRASGVVGISSGYLEWGLEKAGRARSFNDGLFPLGYQEPDRANLSSVEAKLSLQALGVNESRLVCWFLGSFGDTYDLTPVIGAARDLEDSGRQEFQFVLSGDGQARARYEQLAHGLRNVVFTGWLDSPGIASMMDMAWVGIAAYRKGAPQGLPNKIFEYMAAGLPILSSLEGECRRFLAEHACGLSYPAGNSGDFLKALNGLAKDEALAATLGQNGLLAYRQNYSAEILYPRMVEHISAVSSRRRRASCSLSLAAESSQVAGPSQNTEEVMAKAQLF